MGCSTLTMEVQNLSADRNCVLNNQEQHQPCAREKLDEMIAGDSLDYNSWKSLISEIETASPEDIDTISVAYDYFLSKFPLCHWYWEKYAYHKVKLCGAPEAVKIFERGVKAVECSVGFWVDYFKFGTSFFGDPSDVRRLFGRGLSCVGKDYFCHVLWDGYLKYEFNQEGWSFLAQSYIEALKFPTKKLHFYYDNFKKFVSNLEEEMGYENSWSIEVGSVSNGASKINKDEISLVIKDLLDSSDRSIKFKALDRYKSIGNRFYQEARLLDEEIKSFETHIRRRYFHVTPLDDDELTNWHHYLDFIEKQEDLDWAVKLYERCLISCANYPEFWIRYVEFLESKRGYQLAISVLDRPTQIYLKNVPEIHFFNARFKEQIGDADGARAALLLCDAKTDSSFIESVIKQANMEKRLGNLAAASATYEKGLKIASEKQKLHILPTLYFHFARLTFMMTGSADAARDVIIRGIRHLPHCRYLLEELIKFAMMHEGASQVNIVESIIADAISPGSDKTEGLNAKDREDISSLFIEFVDLCGTVHDVRKAWNRHVQLFPKFTRIRALCKKPISGNHLLNAAADQCQSFSLTGLGLDHASKSQSSVHLIKLAEKEQVPVLAVNNDVQPSLVLEEKSMQMDDDNNTKEKLQRLSPEVAVVSKEYASRDNDLAPNLIHRSGDQFSGLVEDLTCRPREDKRELMDITTELVPPHELTQEVRKSSGPIGCIEALPGSSGSINVQSELDHELQQHKQPVSLDDVSSNSQAKEFQEFMPMSCKEYETAKGTSASSRSPPPNFSNVNYNSFASPKSIQTVDSPQLPNESDKERSENHKSHTLAQVHPNLEVSSRSDEDSHPINHTMTAARQSPLSSPPVSYPQQNMLESNLQSSRQLGQTPHDQAMNQMLQYQYQQQQHFLQQQYQQQQQQQQPIPQVQQHYVPQPPYQLQSQQQPNQQHAQLAHQQHYVQQVQQYYQQQMQQQYYQQNQQLTYQMHQQGYQNAAHGHELLLQQFQLYQQGYSPMQLHQGHHQMQEQNLHQHLPQTPQHENLQQQRHQVTSEQNLTRSLSQHQQDQDVATPDFDCAPEPSESSHLQGQSPKVA